MQMPLGVHLPLSDILANDTGDSGYVSRKMKGIKFFILH
jgi:hypothetical protein